MSDKSEQIHDFLDEWMAKHGNGSFRNSNSVVYIGEFARAKDENTYRVEILRSHDSDGRELFSAKYSVAFTCTLQRSGFHTENGERVFDREPEDVTFWVDYELPWVSTSTLEGAISQALSFLAEQKR